MPIKGIIFMAIIFLIIAVCFKNELYDCITSFLRGRNANDEKDINKKENKGENT